MKAQSLWSGHDYAYAPYRHKGQHRHTNIQRVRVVRWYKRKDWGKKNDTTYVEVHFLDWDGNVLNPERDATEVRAYDVVDFWDDYWAEHGEWHLERKKYQDEEEIRRQERIAEANRQREERESKLAAERAQLQMKRNRILQGLHEKGLIFHDDQVGYYSCDVHLDGDVSRVTIKGEELRRWLGIENNVSAEV